MTNVMRFQISVSSQRWEELVIGQSSIVVSIAIHYAQRSPILV